MSQGQFGHFMCHLTVLEVGDDGKARLESETSSEAKLVRNFVSGSRKKDNFKPGSNKKLPQSSTNTDEASSTNAEETEKLHGIKSTSLYNSNQLNRLRNRRHANKKRVWKRMRL